MPDTPNSGIPAPPPGFSPVPDQSAGAIPPPPPGFSPVQSESVMGNPAFDLTATRNEGGTGPVGAAVGFGKGVLQTTAGVGALIHKIPVVGPALIPETGLTAEEKAAEPNGAAEQLGSFAENMGEYMVGDELLEGITRAVKLEQMSKTSELAAHMLKKDPSLMKKVAMGAAKGAAKGAAVGGVQGAVKGAAEGDTLGGAVSGAAGGALGGAVSEGGGAGLEVGKKAMGVGTTAEEDIVRAVKPAKRNDRFLESWDIAKDHYAKEMDENGKYSDFNDAAERMRDMRQDWWRDKVKPKIDAHTDENMFPNSSSSIPPAISALPGQQGSVPKSNPIADAIRARITPAMQKVSPSSAKAIETVAKRFEGPMKVGEGEQIAEHLNAELTNAGYWKASASERAAMDKANPKVSANSAAVEAIRDSLSDYLEKAGEPDLKDLKRTYGAMRNVENEVRGRVNVEGRQAPLSLKQIIGLVSGHPLGIAATLLDKIYNAPISLLNKAVDKTIPDTAVGAAVTDFKEGVKTIVSKGVPAASAAGTRMVFIGGDGKKYLGDSSKWGQIQAADPKAKQVN